MRAVGSSVRATVWGHGNDSKRPVTHRDTHLKMSSNFSRFFFRFPSACFPSPPLLPPKLLFLCLISLVTGNVLIGFFPKLFLIEDKQRMHISLGDVGLPEVSRFFLTVFFMLEGGRMGEMKQETLARGLRCMKRGGGWDRRVFRE